MKNPRNVLKIANINTKNLNTGLPSSYGLPKNKIVLNTSLLNRSLIKANDEKIEIEIQNI